MAQGPNFSRIQWEEIEHYETGGASGVTAGQRTYSLRRAQVPGGWLVQMLDMQTAQLVQPLASYAHPAGVGVGGGITFVPDAGWTWTLA
ncbi:MAG: hypothetical protein U0270_06395 [Labilithrix sp.]